MVVQQSTHRNVVEQSLAYFIMDDAGDEHIVLPPPPVAGDGRPPSPPPPPALPIPIRRAGGPPVLSPGGAPVLPPGGAPHAPGLPLLQQQKQQIIAQLRAVNRQIYTNLPRRAGWGRGRKPRPIGAVTKNYNFY
uniref:Uncharacterized protein n=1 Tax=Amphimedon queenslandica TaxID=400682 RepID=A0A1X7U5J9_AMPQE